VLNAASLAKLHAIKQLSSELIAYKVDIAFVSESHLKKTHPDSCVKIDGYSVSRRDRTGRKGGGVAIYARSALYAVIWTVIGMEPAYEMLWVKIEQEKGTLSIGVLYHPPVPIYPTADLLVRLEEVVLLILRDFPDPHIILAGNFNTLPESEVIIRTSLTPNVTLPTRGYNKLDHIYVSDLHYDGVKFLVSCEMRSSGNCGLEWKRQAGMEKGATRQHLQGAHFSSAC
jgi:Endonuclease/Exonuclease/phosphatase family